MSNKFSRKSRALWTTICFAAIGCSAQIATLDEEAASGDGEVAVSALALTTPADPLFNQQWNLYNQGQSVAMDDGTTVTGIPGVDINIRALWDYTQGSSSVLVAVAETLDIFINHADLRNSIYKNAKEVAGDGKDNDSNGCIDDVYGCDFVDGDGHNGPYAAPHGTHVSGIIAASIGNSTGIVGVAPKIKILPIRARYVKQDPAEANTVVKAIKYAEKMGAKIFHMSQGSPSIYDSEVYAAIAASPMLFVFSAGNGDFARYGYPASFDLSNIISVANLNPAGNLSPLSDVGPHVDIAAPGMGILSTVPSGDPVSPTSDYALEYGTSMAAPHVTGVAALLMNKFPLLSVAEIRSRILRSGMKMSTLAGYANSGATLDAYAAYTDVASFTVTAESTTNSITLRWTSQGSGASYEVEENGNIVATVTQTYYTRGGLAANAARFYRIRAIINGTKGLWTHRWMKRAVVTPTLESAPTGSYLLQSAHPYPNNLNLAYALGRRNAKLLRAHFASLQLNGSNLDGTESGDYLMYQPANGDETQQLHGTYLPYWTDWQPGSFNFWLNSDSANNAYGFAIDAVEYVTGIPDKPGTPSINGTTSNSVELYLPYCPGSTSIKLYRSLSSSSGYSNVATIARNLTTYPTDVTYTNTGLTTKKTYYYKSTCVNDLGTSPYSDVVSAATL